MKIIKIDRFETAEAVKILNEGGLVVYPTETVYGIGVDATNPRAIQKLVKYKKRPFGKPFSIAVTDLNMAKRYADLNVTAMNLYKNFLPGPVTVVSKVKIGGRAKPDNLAPGVASELGTVGVRIPDYPLTLEIIRQLGKPITATSANASYKKRPYKIQDILDNITDKQKSLLSLIIDAGELPHNEPSTVIDTTMDDGVTLRQGKVKFRTSQTILSRSPEATQNLGKELWQKYEKYLGQRAIVFALTGEMGTGKTQFTKGLAKAMGIADTVVSPTFNLHLSYGARTKIKLEHLDAWRLQTGNELANLGIGQLINDKSVIAIEWADKVIDEIREYHDEAIIILVNLEYGESTDERKISWKTN